MIQMCTTAISIQLLTVCMRVIIHYSSLILISICNRVRYLGHL